jgi:hypothetical protein
MDITRETHFRKGNNDECRIIFGKGGHIVLGGFVYGEFPSHFFQI